MAEAKNQQFVQSQDVSDAEFLDVVVDPADLEHLASNATITESAVPVDYETLELSLSDLMPNVDGAVVVLTDDDLPVSLVTDETLSDSGVVDQQVSTGGIDVEGLYYYSFANGLTLYSDTDIVIINE